MLVIPAGNAGIQLPWMAMFKLPIPFRISLLCRSVHPCGLDPGTNLSGTDLHLPGGRQAG